MRLRSLVAALAVTSLALAHPPEPPPPAPDADKTEPKAKAKAQEEKADGKDWKVALIRGWAEASGAARAKE